MSGVPGSKRMNERDWNLVRTLRENGMKSKQVADITKRSSGTQAAIMESKDFADYQRLVAERAKRWAKPKPIRGLDIETDEPELPQPAQVWQFGDESNHLERIAVALERMADAWERKPDEQPAKRGIFGK